LPAHDQAVAELEDTGTRDLHLQAAALATNVDHSPARHPVAEVLQLVVRLETVVVLPGVRTESLEALMASERALDPNP
jgi:hypothetical protein